MTSSDPKIQDVRIDDFSRRFGGGQKMTGDAGNPLYRAYRVIQDHMDYLKQLQGFRDSGENVELSPDIGENATADLVASVGKDKAEEIVRHYGLHLSGRE